MKLVTAVIKPFKLDDVKTALEAFGVHGHDGHRGQRLRPPARPHRGLPRRGVHRRPGAEVRLEVLVDDADAERRRRRHRQGAQTGKIGDGKVWTRPGRHVVRVRTGERGPDAL